MKRSRTPFARRPRLARFNRLLLLGAAASVGVGVADQPLRAQQFDDFTPVTDAVLQDPDPADWLHWRRTLDAWGHSPLDEITADNAGQLRLVWSWALAQGSQQTTPMVYDGVMYIANPGELVQALDAATGELIWEYRREREMADVGRAAPRPEAPQSCDLSGQGLSEHHGRSHRGYQRDDRRRGLGSERRRRVGLRIHQWLDHR